MFPYGTIYDSKKRKLYGEVILHASFGIKVLYSLFRGIGGGIITFAVLGIAFTLWPVFKAEVNYRLHEREVVSEDTFGRLLKSAEADAVSQIKEETASLGIDSYFSVYIPKIDAKSKVIANVDAADRKEYLPALEKGVAHARGTYFPGQGKSVYLFSHSTNSPFNAISLNAVFYLLRKLEKGDKIFAYFVDKKYEYEVVDKFTTDANDTSWLSYEGDGEVLLLQTCDPPGTTLRRLIVKAVPVNQFSVFQYSGNR